MHVRKNTEYTYIHNTQLSFNLCTFNCTYKVHTNQSELKVSFRVSIHRKLPAQNYLLSYINNCILYTSVVFCAL